MTLQQRAGIKPAPIDMNDAITLYQFLEGLKQYECYRLMCMDVRINHQKKAFDSITFMSFKPGCKPEYVHVLEAATTNTALLTLFNSDYLLYQQRRKKDRQPFTPSYWMQFLDKKYRVFAEMRRRKLLLLID